MRAVWLCVLLGCNATPLAISSRVPTCRDALRCVEEECGARDLACLVYRCAAKISDAEHLYNLIVCWKGSCTGSPAKWNEAFEGTGYVNASATCVIEAKARCEAEAIACEQ